MSLFKYFTEEAHARAFLCRGVMRFGSLAYYRGIEDGGVRGDPRDATLHYAPEGGIDITMVADGRKVIGSSFSTTAENMFVYCVSNDMSAERASEFGAFCVEISEPDTLLSRLKARASASSKLDYARAHMGAVDYRPLDRFPHADWAFPERVVLIKPPDYAPQKETRIVLPLREDAASKDEHIFVQIGNVEDVAKLHIV